MPSWTSGADKAVGAAPPHRQLHPVGVEERQVDGGVQGGGGDDLLEGDRLAAPRFADNQQVALGKRDRGLGAVLSDADGDRLPQRHDFIEEGYQVLFERHGRRFGHAVETLTGRMPTPDEAHTLNLSADIPVVHVLRTSYDVNKEHIHTLESVYAADKHVFRIRQPDGTDAF